MTENVIFFKFDKLLFFFFNKISFLKYELLCSFFYFLSQCKHFDRMQQEIKLQEVAQTGVLCQ